MVLHSNFKPNWMFYYYIMKPKHVLCRLSSLRCKLEEYWNLNSQHSKFLVLLYEQIRSIQQHPYVTRIHRTYSNFQITRRDAHKLTKMKRLLRRKIHITNTHLRLSISQNWTCTKPLKLFHFQWAALQTLFRGKELYWWAAGTYLSWANSTWTKTKSYDSYRGTSKE